MSIYRIVASSVLNEPISIFTLKHCFHPEIRDCSEYALPDCPYRYTHEGCNNIQSFNIALMGKQQAFNAALEKLKEINPRGSAACEETNPSLFNLGSIESRLNSGFA